MLAGRRGYKAITMGEIEEATIKVIVGPEKRSHAVVEKNRRLTAFHEAGHAVATYFCPTQDKVHQVSIVPRGWAGGYTLALPEHEKVFVTKKEMHEDIVVLLGGRVAEKLILDDISTGASNDIQRASETARNMVTRYGFSEKLGPIVYGTDQSEVFLGRDLGQNRNYSENVAAEIDGEIRQIIDDAFERCEEILTENMNKVHEVAAYLLENEKIDGENFDKLMKGEPLEPKKAPEPLKTSPEPAEKPKEPDDKPAAPPQEEPAAPEAGAKDEEPPIYY